MDRYTVISTQYQKEWLPGCPVKVNKINILFDNIEHCNVFQIQIKNISSAKIKSVYIDIKCYDDAKDFISEIKEISYINCNKKPQETFGEQQPIKTNSTNVSLIKIIFTKVVYENDTVWRNENNETGILLPQIKASEVYDAVYDQYRVETQKLNISSEFAFIDDNDFWICPCGQGNEKTNTECCNCKMTYDVLKRISDRGYLETAKKERKEKEAELAAKRAELAAEEEKRRIEREEAEKKAAYEAAERARIETEKKKKQIIKESVITVSIIIIGAFLIANISKLLKYKSADNLVQNGEYAKAIEIYTELSDFPDSENKLNEAKNQMYQEIISGKMDYTDMINGLELLAEYNYKDCVTRLTNIKNKFDAITGHYYEGIPFKYEWIITFDYKTNEINATLKNRATKDTVDYNDIDLLSTGGLYGSFIYYDVDSGSYHIVKLYDGYLICDGVTYKKI